MMLKSLRSFFLIFSVFCLSNSCKQGFKHDPTKIYPVLEKGQYWIDHFDQRALQNAKVHDGMLYCNTINRHRGQDFLYCLGLSSGKVIWRIPVDGPASQPVEVYKKQLYYSTTMGDIYKLSMGGEILWQQKLSSSYSGHRVMPKNGNLIVNSVVNGAFEFDSSSGEIVQHYRYDSKSGLCSMTLPLFYQDQIIFANAPLDAGSGREAIMSIDYTSKELRWLKPIPSRVIAHDDMGFLLIKDRIVLVDRKGGITAYDPSTGESVWEKKLSKEEAESQMLFRSKTLGETFLYHKGKEVQLNSITGEELSRNDLNRMFIYEVDQEGVERQVIVEDKLEISGISVSVE